MRNFHEMMDRMERRECREVTSEEVEAAIADELAYRADRARTMAKEFTPPDPEDAIQDYSEVRGS